MLLPALTALSSWDFESDEAVMEFAKGDLDELHVAHALDLYDSSDPSTAIDQMIELSNPPCANCEEGSEECLGSQYVFAGQHGQYEPLYVASESEIDELMRQISPSYSSS